MYRERPEVLFAHQDGAATSVLETSGTTVVVRVLTRWTDLVEAMVDVVAGAREQLVVTGSRSRENAYLAAIETAVAQQPDLVHYRVLYGPPRHRALADHLLRLLELRDPSARRNGIKTLHKRKAARTATHTAALADLRTHRLVTTGGSTSGGEALRHLTLKGLEAAATELQRPLSEMGATARGAGAAGASHPMAVNETTIGLLRPKPDLAKLATDPPALRAAAQAIADAPGGVGSIGSYWTEVPLPVAGSWSTPGRGGAQADIVLTAPQDGVPLLFVEVDNCHETAEELADKLEKYARFYRRKVKDTVGKAQPMWRTRWNTPPGGGLENPYPPVLFVFNPLGARNPERTIARLAALTRHLWAGTKDYEEDFHHYDRKMPVTTTTLAVLREHGPHGQVFHRFGRPGPQTLFDAIGNPRRQAALERHWAQQRAREREAQERERQEVAQRAAKRTAQRPACARCGTKFTDERWRAAQPTDWGTPADSHPDFCERCKGRAVAAGCSRRRFGPASSAATRRTRNRPSRRGSPAGGSHVGVPEEGAAEAG